jgi:methanogenic corrinoid protein MtbC1
MANVYDASDVNNNWTSGRGRRKGYKDLSCGGDIDWSLGLKALPKPAKIARSSSDTLLTKVIEGEIIPRLLLAHRPTSTNAKVESEVPCDFPDADTVAQLVLSNEPHEIAEKVDLLRRRGVKLEQIFLDFLAPVARKLGEFWEEDRCSFTDVTLGLVRLHQLLYEVSSREVGIDAVGPKRRAYFVPSPGEQHTFGLCMLEEFFLHAGWETASNHSASAATIIETVAAQKLDVVGFSVGCFEYLDSLSSLIERVRVASRNPNIVIMVGGRIFSDSPGSVERVKGATVICDGVHAVRMAEKLISRCSSDDPVEKFV